MAPPQTFRKRSFGLLQLGRIKQSRWYSPLSRKAGPLPLQANALRPNKERFSISSPAKSANLQSKAASVGRIPAAGDLYG